MSDTLPVFRLYPQDSSVPRLEQLAGDIFGVKDDFQLRKRGNSPGTPCSPRA